MSMPTTEQDPLVGQIIDILNLKIECLRDGCTVNHKIKPEQAARMIFELIQLDRKHRQESFVDNLQSELESQEIMLDENEWMTLVVSIKRAFDKLESQKNQLTKGAQE